MLRILENFLRRSRLDDHAVLHYRHAVAHARNNAEVMRDQYNGRTEALLHIFHQIEDLSLNGYVKRRRRLVRDQRAGLHASAMAIMTRRMPPENSCGYWL